MAQGVALYVCAILAGAGVLVFPGQAASLAGAASLIAWGFSALVGCAFGVHFRRARLAVPGCGWCGHFRGARVCASAGGVAGWWFFIAGSVGQTIVPLTAGYYVAAAFGVGQEWAPGIAAVVLAIAVLANLIGLQLGARVQIGLAIGVAAILITVIVIAVPQIRLENLAPFAPHGIGGIGQSVIVLFFAFAGMGSNSPPVCRIPRRAPNATATYFSPSSSSPCSTSIAFAVVGTGSYGTPALDQHLSASSLRTVSDSPPSWPSRSPPSSSASAPPTPSSHPSLRLRFRTRPRRMGALTAHQTNPRGHPLHGHPQRGSNWSRGPGRVRTLRLGNRATIVFIPSVLVLATYLLGAAAAARLFDGKLRLLAFVTIGLLLVTVPFAGWHLLLPVAVAALVIGVRKIRESSQRQRHPVSS